MTLQEPYRTRPNQFLTSVEFGVKRDRATLRALRTLPIPFAEYSRTELASWVDLHARLIKVKPLQRLEGVIDQDVTGFEHLLRELQIPAIVPRTAP